jgi:aspartate 1-decarboxylase
MHRPGLPAGLERHAMLLTMMRAKLHRATVTQADVDYEGSIAIDKDLLDASTLLPHEQVDVLNVTTGARFTTYVIEAPRGSRTIGVNGAAARLVAPGDKVIVVAYGRLDAAEARAHQPVVVLLGDDNRPKPQVRAAA